MVGHGARRGNERERERSAAPLLLALFSPFCRGQGWVTHVPPASTPFVGTPTLEILIRSPEERTRRYACRIGEAFSAFRRAALRFRVFLRIEFPWGASRRSSRRDRESKVLRDFLERERKERGTSRLTKGSRKQKFRWFALFRQFHFERGFFSNIRRRISDLKRTLGGFSIRGVSHGLVALEFYMRRVSREMHHLLRATSRHVIFYIAIKLVFRHSEDSVPSFMCQVCYPIYAYMCIRSFLFLFFIFASERPRVNNRQLCNCD